MLRNPNPADISAYKKHFMNNCQFSITARLRLISELKWKRSCGKNKRDIQMSTQNKKQRRHIARPFTLVSALILALSTNSHGLTAPQDNYTSADTVDRSTALDTCKHIKAFLFFSFPRKAVRPLTTKVNRG